MSAETALPHAIWPSGILAIGRLRSLFLHLRDGNVQHCLAILAFAAAPAARTPKSRRGHFFSWFNLKPDGEPKTTGRDACVSFRPLGAAFNTLVRLDVMVRSAERIVGSELRVDRSIVDGMQSSFARDIVASFLGWALEDEEAEAKNVLIASIGEMSAANDPVIMPKDDAPPKPSADRNGAYAVFSGHRELATLALGGTDFTLRNGTSDDRSLRWLTIKIACRSNDFAS